MLDDIWFPVFRMECLECGKLAPAGFALCDTCAPIVYGELGQLLSFEKVEDKKDENSGTRTD